MISIQKVTLGADPEVFLKNRTTGKLVSAIGKVGGTKTNPVSMGDGYFCQEDNVLAEFNIPPADTKERFTLNILEGLERLRYKIPEELDLEIIPFGYLDDSELDSREAMAFGCNPDLNCWTMEYNPTPEPNFDGFRSAGGHICIGYDNPDVVTSQSIGKSMDLFLSVPSIFMSDETPRRRLYGQMGSIRFTHYGVEYRTPSNFWIINKERIEWAFNQTKKAISFINSNKRVAQEDYEVMKRAVNFGDKPAARYLLDSYSAVG